jgi:glutamine synthetase
MLFSAPPVNSYTRSRVAAWAPTRLGWSRYNRPPGFRVVGRGSSLRIECRIPGADCNPYLAYAAAIISGLDGIERRIEPPDPVEGDVYAATGVERVPLTLEDATRRFRGSELARRVLGDDVVDHYAHAADVEADAFRRAVTDWERARYFERI